MLSYMASYGILLATKYASRALWDIRTEWVGEVCDDPWDHVRLIAVLHHTSLAEGIYASVLPNEVLRRVARHAVVPVARETMERPIEGRFFRTMIPNVVSITRRRDHSWARVIQDIDDPESMVALFPEGRMMRPDGRDKRGEIMTVKPGIAEVLRALGNGRMILAYSGGLHHVFPPGASRPRFFQSLTLRLESLDIATYVSERSSEPPSFRDAVVRDLTRRRDLYTPVAPGTPAAVSAEVVRRRQAAWAGHALGAGGRENGARESGRTNGRDGRPARGVRATTPASRRLGGPAVGPA